MKDKKLLKMIFCAATFALMLTCYLTGFVEAFVNLVGGGKFTSFAVYLLRATALLVAYALLLAAIFVMMKKVEDIKFLLLNVIYYVLGIIVISIITKNTASGIISILYILGVVAALVFVVIDLIKDFISELKNLKKAE